jgi:hypothetical protein
LFLLQIRKASMFSRSLLATASILSATLSTIPTRVQGFVSGRNNLSSGFSQRTYLIQQQFYRDISRNKMATTTTTTTHTDSDDDADTSKNGLFLFDFDGVVCNSCDECTVSAWRTLKTLKVLMMDDNDDDDSPPEYPPEWLFEKMREIRPAIEVGWQIPVLLSVFWEQQQQQRKKDTSILSVPEIIANYERLVDDWLSSRNLTDRDMIDTFGGVRDKWIEEDLKSWLDINTFYEKVPESLNNCRGKSVLVTTKQQRFAIALCRHAGVTPESLPDDLIYGLGQYKNKADVIVDQMATTKIDHEDTYFFEDRWPTLAKCLKDERLDGVRLHLCAWGYVTKGELALAEAEPRVTVLGLDDFASLVQGK